MMLTRFDEVNNYEVETVEGLAPQYFRRVQVWSPGGTRIYVSRNFQAMENDAALLQVSREVERLHSRIVQYLRNCT